MEKFFVYSSIISSLLPLIVGVKVIKTKPIRQVILIYALVASSFSIDVFSNIIARIYGHNYWAITIYFALELLLLTYFFFLELKHRIILIIGGVLALFLLYQLVTLGLNVYPSKYDNLNSLVQIFFSLWCYYLIFKRGDDIFIENSYLFWINTGILVYFSVGFFSVILSTEILSSSSLIWAFHNFANILKNIFFAIGLWKARRT